ncbi:Membrane primary amine oxidase [Heterocephalus glaber]|uniref:Amine oxidase n=1 Tax=Heterocephalus glaber TaxID=10181 RepID=G5BAI8_HETGA|nr:Membrane primary amine oxidase [Heterocephalus glaber]
MTTAPRGLQSGDRATWFGLYYNVSGAGIFLHPVGLELLVDHGAPEPARWVVRQVVFQGRHYESLPCLEHLFEAGLVKVVPVPDNGTGGAWSLKSPVPPGPAPPLQFPPQGPRFSVQGSRVASSLWAFSFGLGAFSGPRVFDIRFRGERVAYEVSVQEALAVYGGNSPAAMLTHYMDSSFGIGKYSTPLARGVDCPYLATYVDRHFLVGSQAPKTIRDALCVFEQNQGLPLRRHHSDFYSHYYGGVADTVLVVRSVATLLNYDYVWDVIFHPNGAIEVRVHATGYISSSFFFGAAQRYGNRVGEHVLGTVHTHSIHFKVDLDVAGGTRHSLEREGSVDPMRNSGKLLEWPERRRCSLVPWGFTFVSLSFSALSSAHVFLSGFRSSSGLWLVLQPPTARGAPPSLSELCWTLSDAGFTLCPEPRCQPALRPCPHVPGTHSALSRVGFALVTALGQAEESAAPRRPGSALPVCIPVGVGGSGPENWVWAEDLAFFPAAVPWRPEHQIQSLQVTRKLLETEEQAAFALGGATPHYLYLASNRSNKWGHPRGYRVQTLGPVGELLPPNSSVAGAFSWVRYQLAVTRRKEEESSSSSIFNQNDPWTPTVDFADFINNETITGEDLVAWVTAGFLHIPHAEDIPNTVTAGNGVGFFLRPYNFFDEDPSFRSADSVYFQGGQDAGACELNPLACLPLAAACAPGLPAFSHGGFSHN